MQGGGEGRGKMSILSTLSLPVQVLNAPISVKPQGGGGRERATHGKLTEHAFPWVGNLTWPPSWKTERNWK